MSNRPGEEDGGNELRAAAIAALAMCERITDQYPEVKYGVDFRALQRTLERALDKHSSLARASAGAAAAAQSHSCWSCEAPVTAEERTAADGNCPHCGVELDDELWPGSAAQAQGGNHG